MRPRDTRGLFARLFVVAGALLIVLAVAGVIVYALRDETSPEEQVLATAERYNSAVEDLDWREMFDLLPRSSQERIGRDCLRIMVQRTGSGRLALLVSKLPEYRAVDVRGDHAIAKAAGGDSREFVHELGGWRVNIDYVGLAKLAGLTPPDCAG